MLGEPFACFHLRQKIEKALAYDGNVMGIENLYAAVLTGKMQLWGWADGSPLSAEYLWTPARTMVRPDSVNFTEIMCYPDVRAVRSYLAAGTLSGIKAMTPFIIEWAKSIGCTRAEFCGRHGWAKLFPDFNYRPAGWMNLGEQSSGR